MGRDLDEISEPDLLGQPLFVIKDQMASQECLFDLAAKCLAQVW